jgi:integrase
MSVYRRGKVWWYKFKFAGQEIRESSKSDSKTIAKDAERARRRELETSFNRIPVRERVPLFKPASQQWISQKCGLSRKSIAGYEQRLEHVNAYFGQTLVCDINRSEVLVYRAKRLQDGASNRTVNYEVGCIRGVLKQFGLWSRIADQITRLRENHDAGRAISHEHEDKLLKACRASQAPSLLPIFIFARDTGLRASEMKALRRHDLKLEWKDGVIVSGEVIVPRSKTEAGTGRCVPFTQDVCSTLTLWLSRFDGGPATYVFPSHEVQMLKGGKQSQIVKSDLSKPVQSWQRAWRTALDAAGVHYRWHDLRHTFITRLAENPAVSEQTIKALAGHVSKQMLERYSHIRAQAKRDAIAALRTVSPGEGAQKWAQSTGAGKAQ